MPDLPTRATYFQIGETEVITRSAGKPPGQAMTVEAVRTDGSDANLIMASASGMADEVTRQLALRVGALFLDGAKGTDLDRLVADRWSPSIVRKEASPAVGEVVFFRVSGPLPAITIPATTRLRTATGIEFVTTATVTFAAGAVGPVTAPVRALLAGPAGNVAAATVNALVTQGIDPGLVVSNPEPMTGGDARETDARLRERARAFWLAARRGTLSAIEFGALTVAGVRQASAIELTDASGLPDGRVQLFIADALGQANAALVAAVLAALVEYRAAGVVVQVIGATPIYQRVRFRLRFEAGVDTTRAFDLVRAATIARVNGLRPRATLPVSMLFEAARSVPGVIVLDDAILEPIGDVVPSGSEVIRTRADLITAE
jgi:uncharacterized phage protein gp47/JayE